MLEVEARKFDIGRAAINEKKHEKERQKRARLWKRGQRRGGGCGKFVSEKKALEAGRVEGNIGVNKGEKEEEGMF